MYLDKKGVGGATRLRWELNQLFTTVQASWPHRNMFCVRRCSDAGPADRWQVLASRYCTECPKQGSERFNCQVRRNTLPIWVCYLFLGDWNKQICICICRPIDNFHCSFFLSIQQNNLFYTLHVYTKQVKFYRPRQSLVRKPSILLFVKQIFQTLWKSTVHSKATVS